MGKESKLNVNFAELTDDELLDFRNQLLIQREMLNSDYVEELKNRTRGDFDPYTRRGEKTIKKILKKFEDRDLGLSYLEELVAEEWKKRDKYKEEQMYINGLGSNSTMTEAEFLEREKIITESYKSKIEEN